MDVPSLTREELDARLVDAEREAAFPPFAREVFANLDVVAEPVKDWLAHEDNRLLPRAVFIYRGWLDARGRLIDVSQPIKDWLGHENNRLIPQASFLYQAWLQAGGRFAFIRKEVFEWLMTHGFERNAGYLLKYVVKQRVLPDDVTLQVLGWCAKFADQPDAIWRLNSLLAHVSADLFPEALRASEAVLEPMFSDASLSGLTRSQVTTILGNLAKLEQIASLSPSRELDSLLCRWMSHPQSFGPSLLHAPQHQTRQLLARLVAAAEGAFSTPELSPLIDWVATWDDRTRSNCKDLVKRLRTLRHTATGGRWRRRTEVPSS
jgi:hypothetical protein